MIVEPGAVIGGKYKLERKLAAGGMGSVWIAKHLQLQTDVAVKLLDAAAAGSADARARFEREAKALSKLRHPNVVQVHDFGLEDDMPYLVMELLRGESLEERLRREKRIPIKVVSTMLAQVAKGLRRAHEAGFVHRDLKPGNLFIAKTDDEEKLVVLDFGIAKQTGVVIDNSTKTGEFMGSPHYMSPEQIRDSKDIDARSDLWSLAVILFRALSGSLPFPGTTLGAVLADVVSAPIPKLSEVAPDLFPELDAFFDKAFSRDRTKRYSSAREMSEAFDAVLRAKEPPAPGRRGEAAQKEAGGAPGLPRPGNSTNLPSNAAVGKEAAPAAGPGAAPPKAAGPSGTALYSREALRLPPAPASDRAPAPAVAPPAAGWDDPSKRGPMPVATPGPVAAAWDDPSKRGLVPAPVPASVPAPASASVPASVSAPVPVSAPAAVPASAPPAAAWDDRSQRAFATGSLQRPTWDDPSQRGPAPAPHSAAWDDRSQRAFATGSLQRPTWDDPSQRGPAPTPPAATWDDRSQRGFPMGAPSAPGSQASPTSSVPGSHPGAAPPPPSNAGAAPSRPPSWEEASQRNFPGLAGQPPLASPIPAPPPASAPFDPTLSSSHGSAPPRSAPVPEPRSSTQGFDPMRGPGASTPVLGSTLTVSPSARDSSAERSRTPSEQPLGPPSAVPFAAKAGAAAFGAILTVIILVFALRSKPTAPPEATPGTTETAPSATPTAPIEAPPPAPTPAPVEGVIDMAEGEAVEEAIAAEPELLEQMDAGPGATGPRIPPIPYGKARLIVVSKSGPCKVTVNGISQGVTPVHIFVPPGKAKVYCRLKTGSTRSRELEVPRMRTTFVIFENPAVESPKPK